MRTRGTSRRTRQAPGGRSSTQEAASAQAGASTIVAVQAAFRDYVNALADRAGAVIHIADIPDDPVLLSYVWRRP